MFYVSHSLVNLLFIHKMAENSHTIVFNENGGKIYNPAREIIGTASVDLIMVFTN